LQSDVPQGRL